MRKLLKFSLSLILWLNFWIVSLISVTLLLIVSLVIPKKFYDPLVCIVCRIICCSVFIFPRLKTEITKDFPFPVVYVANHVSFFDLFISGAVLPGYPRGLELKEHFTKPIYGWFISRFGQIPIDSSSFSSVKNSLEFAVKMLVNRGRNLLVMPEGKRTRTGKLSQFRNGAFFISRKGDIPVVPVVYKNLFNLNNPTSLIISPGILDVYLLEPVYPDKFSNEKEMSLYVRQLISKKLEE